jgi:hypothetical protein
MKQVSTIWLLLALFVFPCILNIESLKVCIFLVIDGLAAYLMFKKYNKEYIN